MDYKPVLVASDMQWFTSIGWGSLILSLLVKTCDQQELILFTQKEIVRRETGVLSFFINKFIQRLYSAEKRFHSEFIFFSIMF
jgi:hypothetical protein